jgi:hypothetical protein
MALGGDWFIVVGNGNHSVYYTEGSDSESGDGWLGQGRVSGEMNKSWRMLVNMVVIIIGGLWAVKGMVLVALAEVRPKEQYNGREIWARRVGDRRREGRWRICSGEG